MDFRPFRRRASRWALTAALSAVLAIVATAQQVQIQIPVVTPPTPADEDPYGVYLPTDRTLSRGMSRARERLADREYNEALAFLQQVLDREEDSFLDDAATSDGRSGLKASARELIANLPPDGREMYQLLHAAAARRQLDAALVSGDRAALAKLVRQYFLTSPGYEAALVLAQIESDRGHPLAAAHLYEQLLADSTIAAPFEPQLSLLAAVSWSAAGQPQQAAKTLRTLTEKLHDAQIELAGRKLRLPPVNSSDDDLVAWLIETVGKPQPIDASTADWLTQRGDATRNTQHRGGAPHLSARWQSRVVNDPRFETFLTRRRQEAQRQGIAAIAAARPIAAGDVVLMRTPQNVVAVDFLTGKRIWETREEESATRDQYLSEFMSGNNGDEWPALSHPLEQRIWDDTLTMSLSSDGQRVFAISGMSLAQRDEPSGWGIGPAFGGPYDFAAAPTNRLTAYELPTEGKLAWEIDGANASDELSGAFFLGPPLAVDGSLFVLAEIRSAVYLLALEPTTGKLEWRQQLVGLEQGITLDPQRRLQGAAPSYAAGILVCPTTAGMVVAVDAIRREFAWVYRYPRQVEAFANIRPGWQGRTDLNFPRNNNHWLDGSIVIADDKVFITPPESAEIHCLELSTGKQLWKKPRDKSLFLACADRGNVLLVDSESVTALRAKDGAPAWSKEHTELPDDVMPAGLGYLSEGRYYLPLTSGQVIAVDTQDGTATGAVDARSGVEIGNLICHRGAIVSQSTLFLDKFEQIDVLRQRAETALAANPRDATAIRDLAEMRRLEGALAESVKMLKQAYKIDPADALTRDMLADALLAALADDYSAYRVDTPMLREIIYRPQQQVELLRIEAEGLQAAGQTRQALDAYLQLVDATASEPTLLVVGTAHSVRSDNWIRARLNSLWEEASADDRSEIKRRLEGRVESWSDPPTISQLRTHLAHFGGLPGTDEMRQKLIHELIARNELLDAELELFRLAQSPDTNTQAAAAVATTQWLMSQGRLIEARRLADTLVARWPDATTIDGKSTEQWVNEWRSELSADTANASNWPRGQVSVEVLPAERRGRREATRRAQMEFQLGLRKLRLEQLGDLRLGPSQWLIAQDNSRLIGRDEAGKDVFRFNSTRNSALRRFPGNSDLVQAAQLGDLLFVTLGGQVMALDTREIDDNDESDVLWKADPDGRFPVLPNRNTRRNGKTIFHSWSQRKRLSGQLGMFVAGLGPATPAGIVFKEQQWLYCVDPVSGETLWTRTGLPAGCELFGDDEFVLAADVEEATLDVIKLSDGELVERRDLPETPWLLTSGRNVAQLLDRNRSDGARKSLRIVDGVSGKTLWENEYVPAVRMTTAEPNFVATLEPDGKFQLIDVRTAKVVTEQTLPLESPPKAIMLLVAGDQVFLGVSGAARQQSSRPIGPDFPLVDGQVFAFDLRDGRMNWPGPAVVEQRGIPLAQPADVPVLVFVDKLSKRDPGGAGTKLRLLCLDRQTGATVYRNDDLPDTSGSHLRIYTDRSESDAVNIEMSTKTVRLVFSDRPRSPEPPANDLVEAPRKSLGRGLWGVGRRMGSVIQGVIQDPAGTNWPLPASEQADQAEVEPAVDDD